MNRPTDQRIRDILAAIKKCQRYASVLDHVDPNLAEMAEDATQRNLQIIGEATKHLPSAIVDAHPEIAWPQIRGFRNILVHEYFGVDTETIRDVIAVHLPPLMTALSSYLA